MRKSFVLLSCALALAIWSALSFAQEQGSGASSKAGDSSASQSSPNDVPSPDDLPGSKPSTPAPNSAQSDSSAPQSQSQKQNSDAKSSRPQQTRQQTKKQASDQDLSGDDSPPRRIPAPPRSDDPSPAGEDANARTPMNKGESSSNDTKVDLSPPLGDAADHPDSSPDPSAGPAEFHAWDPHRAMKNVEVGDYYFKRENYRAAASRYQEALQWKPRDAEATYKLAEAYEKMGDTIDARHTFEQYLSILPKGPRAEEAHKALARLEQK